MHRLLLATLLTVISTAQAKPLDLKADLADRNARAMAQSHCEGDEIPVFTCKIGKKIASICASKILDAKHGYLQYRFGTRGQIELNLPPKQTYKPAMVGYMNASCASCSANYLRFTNRDYSYYIFNTSIRGADDPKSGASTREENSGVIVTKNGTTIYSRRCSAPAFDHNFGEHFWGKAVITLGTEDDVSPLDLDLPSKP